MAKQPKTTSEHLISIYGYITGLKREVSSIKNNHLKHIQSSIAKIQWIMTAVGLGVLAQVLVLVTKHL